MTRTLATGTLRTYDPLLCLATVAAMAAILCGLTWVALPAVPVALAAVIAGLLEPETR